MKTSKILFITLLSAAFFSDGLGQLVSERKYDPTKAVLNALQNAIQSKYGNNYEIGYHIIDSLIANARSKRFADPYGTLAGCVLFSAWHTWNSNDSVVTGMYKNGQIIWDDYPGTKAVFGSKLLTTKDINNDGEVDILEVEYDDELTYREGPGVSYLWILSWNGTRGKIINDIDPATRQSTLVSTGGLYKLADINRNGVQVILGEIDDVWQRHFPKLNPATLPNITYSWDGNKYGFFPYAHQISANEFFPADLMGISLGCRVTKSGIGYVYTYTCTNQLTSKQSVEDIYVGGLRDTSSLFAPEGWNASNPRYFDGRLFYNATFETYGTIGPGHILSGFGTVSVSPPTIVKYYVQGFRPFSQQATDEEYRADIITNSVSGFTLGTRDTSLRINPVDFLDTITNYANQSRSLSWIKDQSTANRYVGYFGVAKTSLQQNNVASTRAALQQVLQDVNVDSSSTLTSEAYALMRYNTEYLLDQLTAQSQEPPFVVQVDSLSASLATAHANGWIGDRGFTNSLNKQLTDARKNLGKGNLTRASAQLQNFVNRLQKVYHHTLEEQQKGKRRPKNFVTEEGFTFLAGKTTELLTKLGSLGEILSVPGQFTTIQAAVNAAKPGATIEVDAGTYKELVEIQKKDSLTLLASEEVTIQGVRIARSNVITVKGFIIDAAGTKKDAVEIEGQENTDITIEANEIVNSSKDGISAGKHNVRTRIVNNVIAGNEKNGIDFAAGTDGAQYVLNNTIVKNGWNGVEAASQKNLSLVNNIISFNGTAKGDGEGRYGVKREGKAGAGKIVLLNNLIIGNDGKVNKQSSKDVANYDQVLDGADNGNITTTGTEGLGVSGSSVQSFGDVLLEDYRLTEISVAIDKGTVSFAAPDADSGKLPEEDKDGNPRPQRTSTDLGAFELE
jgi:hypothetical protein